MFKSDASADRALGETRPRPNQSGVALAGRIGVFRRAAVALAIGSTLLVAGAQAGVAHADPNSVPAGQVNILTNNQTGLVADDANSSNSAGNQMIQWPANGGFNQDWVFVPSTGVNAGYDEIQNRLSGLCLDVSGASTAQDAPVIQWTCTGNANQQWKVESTAASGTSLLQNENSGGYLSVAGGENDGDPGAGADLVQDVDNSNYTDTWKVSPTSYQMVTSLETGIANFAGTQDPTDWACVSGYHFRMASPGTYNYSTNKWTALPQAYVDDPFVNSAVDGNNAVSPNQGPDGGLYQGTDNDPVSESWTNARVMSQPGDYGSDPDPSGASSGHGVVTINYYYSGAFQWLGLDEQVHLHCDPDS